MYQNVTEGKLTFVYGRVSFEDKRKIEASHFEPGLYPNYVNIVVALNNKIREHLGAQAFEYKRICISLDKITQKIAGHLPENESVFFSQFSYLSRLFGCDLEQNQTRVIKKGKSPRYSQSSYDIIRIQT